LINIYSDPHQGLNLASNTTSRSRKELKEFIALNTAKIVDELSTEPATVVCAGDFYHTYRNSEEDIYASMWSASKTDYILAGNHDVTNVKGAKGSLDLMATVFDKRVVPCKFGKVNYKCITVKPFATPSKHMIIVPHHSSQELFMQSLIAAAAEADKLGDCILITHCNYDSPFISDDVTLHMSKRLATDLLKSFKYIFLGHEHNHRTDLDGRLVVIGSPHPTGFGDISDKYVVSIDPDFTKPIMKEVWRKSRHYLECGYRDLPDLLNEDHQWVKITGKIVPSELHELASTIRTAWKLFTPFAIKSEVKILTGDITAAAYNDSSVERINEIIEMELKNSPELYALWRQINDDQALEAN